MRRAVGFCGRALVTVGLLLLLFVAYQLWGTGFYERRAQARLHDEFAAALRARQATTTTTSAGPPATSTTAAPATTTTVERPPTDAVAVLRIPRIGVERVVVEGVTVADLRKGPGHYPDTPLPGEVGNAAIAGHRTTYGAPFNRLDELDPGDEILVTTLAGEYRYVVTSSEVVKPTELSVLSPTTDATLTLTTCNPKYSASQRLVVHARLEQLPGAPPPAPPANPPGTRAPPATGDTAGIVERHASRWPAVLWGLVAAAVGALWWWAFHRRPHWTTWLAGAVPFLVVLFFFYAHLERLLPSSY